MVNANILPLAYTNNELLCLCNQLLAGDLAMEIPVSSCNFGVIAMAMNPSAIGKLIKVNIM